MTYTNLPYLKSRSVLLDSSIKQILIFHIVGIIISLVLSAFSKSSYSYLLLSVDLMNIVKQPWTLLTSSIVNENLFTCIFSAISIYFSSRLFEMYFGAQRIWPVFLFSVIIGGLSIFVFSIFASSNGFVSLNPITSICLLFTLVAYDPKLKVNLFFLNQVRLLYIVIIFFVLSILAYTKISSIAPIIGYVFTTLAAVLVGVLFRKSIDITSPYRHAFYWIEEKFGFRPKMKIIQGGRALSDDDYNHNRKEKQLVLDEILDKINQKGIHSLTKKEKEFLEKFGKE